MKPNIVRIACLLIAVFLLCSCAQDSPAPATNDETAVQDDFGISLQIIETSSTGIVMECTQSGGAPLGELSTIWYVLRDESGYVRNLANSGEVPSYEHPIETESATVLTIDWSKEYGELPSGPYKLVLFVEDVYGEFSGKPFDEYYRTVKKYDPIFTIP